MLFTLRDENGDIIAVSSKATQSDQEALPIDHPDIITFLTRQKLEHSDVNLNMLMSDLKMARVIEDLIQLLIDKDLILFTDLPEPAQKIILHRRTSRKKISTRDEDTLFGMGDD